MTGSNGTTRKPKALAAGSRLGVFAPASPAETLARTLPGGNRQQAPWASGESRYSLSFVMALDWDHFRDYALAIALGEDRLLLAIADVGFEFHDGVSSLHRNAKVL